MINYTAAIKGTWDPGGIPPFDFPLDLYHAHQEAVVATRTLLDLPDDTLDFHLVATPAPGEAVQRQRWRVFYRVGGPGLVVGASEPHPSEIALTATVYPHSEVQQVTSDPDYSMPYGGVFAGIIPALILRQRFGAEPRAITLAGLGTGTFTPDKLTFPDLFSPLPQITVPYATEGLASYNFVLPPGSQQRPSMWLVTEDASWKVSYCSENPNQIFNQRWDEADDPAPSFTPLPAPNPEEPLSLLG